MITASNRSLFKTHREAEKRQVRKIRTERTLAGMREAGPDDHLVDPAACLGLDRNACRNTTSLHMGKKGMTRLHPAFQEFLNLEELWVNGNRLSRLEGLLPPAGSVVPIEDGHRGCARIKRLYASDNALQTLDGDIPRLRHLEVLLLANNRLSNLELTSKKLTCLRSLRQLDLFGNPLAEEKNYRLYLIFHHPSVQLLDRMDVTVAERREAAAMFGRRGAAARASSAGGTASPALTPTLADTPTSMASGGIASGPGALRASTAGGGGVAFGTHLPPASALPPVEKISASAKLVEAKVRQLRMKERAAEVLDQEKDQRIAHARAERRRLFHALWAIHGKAHQQQFQPGAAGGGLPPAGSKAAAAAPPSAPVVPPLVGPALLLSKDAVAPDADAAMSRLYDDVDDENSPIAELLNLARQREVAHSDARRTELDAQIHSKKYLLFPSRITDGFGEALSEANRASKATVDAEYANKLLTTVYTPVERDAAGKAFASSNFFPRDTASLLKLLVGGAARLDANGEITAHFQKHVPDVKVGVPVRAALRLLADCTAFLDSREAHFYAESQRAAGVLPGKSPTPGAVPAVGSSGSPMYAVSFIANHRAKLAKAATDATRLGAAFTSLRCGMRGAKHALPDDTDSD